MAVANGLVTRSQLTGHSVSELVALETKVLWKTHDVRVPLPSIASASSP